MVYLYCIRRGPQGPANLGGDPKVALLEYSRMCAIGEQSLQAETRCVDPDAAGFAVLAPPGAWLEHQHEGGAMSKSKDKLRQEVEDLLVLRGVAAAPFLVQPGRRKTALELREEVIEGVMIRFDMSREEAEEAVDAFM